MDNRTMVSQVKYLAVAIAAVVFLAAAVNLPTETFFGIFAAGLFLIPAILFVYIIQKVAAAQE